MKEFLLNADNFFIILGSELTLVLGVFLLLHLLGEDKVTQLIGIVRMPIGFLQTTAVIAFNRLLISPSVFLFARLKFGKVTPDQYFQSVVDPVMENFIGDCEAFTKVAASFERPFRSMKDAKIAARLSLGALQDRYTRVEEGTFRKNFAKWSGTKATAFLIRFAQRSVLELNICDFYTRRTAGKVSRLLNKHKDAGVYLIRLNNNPGGTCEQVLRVLDLLSNRGSFEVRDKANRRHHFFLTETKMVCEVDGIEEASWLRLGNRTGTRPIVVEVDEGTASGSEILATVLQVYRDALIAGGQETFGKKFGQEHFSLPDGSTLCLSTLRIVSGDQSPVTSGIVPQVITDNAEHLSAIAYALGVKTELTSDASDLAFFQTVSRCVRYLTSLGKAVRRGRLSMEDFGFYLRRSLAKLQQELGTEVWFDEVDWCIWIDIPKTALYYRLRIKPALLIFGSLPTTVWGSTSPPPSPDGLSPIRPTTM